jgi:hypothetical protein
MSWLFQRIAKFRLSSFMLVIVFSIFCRSHPTEGKRSGIDHNSDHIKYVQDMIQKGQRLLKEKRYRAAISYFKRSHDRIPDVKNLYTLGAIHSKLKQCPQALSYWLSAQVMCGRCGLSNQLDLAVRKHTESCSSDISVQSLPRSKVMIDGQEVGETPYTSRLLHGTHTLSLAAVGYTKYQIRVQADRGRSVNVDVALNPQGQQTVRPNSTQISTNMKTQSSLVQMMRPSPVQTSIPADAWLKAEEAADQSRNKNKVLKNILIGSGVILGLGSLGLFAYSLHKHGVLLDKTSSVMTKDDNLFQQAQQAEMIQTTSRVIGALGIISITSTLFLTD